MFIFVSISVYNNNTKTQYRFVYSMYGVSVLYSVYTNSIQLLHNIIRKQQFVIFRGQKRVYRMCMYLHVYIVHNN